MKNELDLGTSLDQVKHWLKDDEFSPAPRVYKCIVCGVRRCGKRNETCEVCKDKPTYKQIRAAAYSQWE